MASGLIKTKGQKTSFYAMARERLGDLRKGMLNNPAFVEHRKKLAKLQKSLTK